VNTSFGIVSVVQAGLVSYDSQRSFENVTGLAADATPGVSRLEVFPEAFVSV
jgi:hypothetical protein